MPVFLGALLPGEQQEIEGFNMVQGHLWQQCCVYESILHSAMLGIFRLAAACYSLRIHNMPYNKRDKYRPPMLLVFAALSHVGLSFIFLQDLDS